MKFNASLALIFILLSSTVYAFADFCNEDKCSDMNDKSCQCWCSVKCGPREKGTGPKTAENPEGDKPFLG